jgi:oligoendopeptidase F
MNYEEKSINSLFTLIHEAGHSMHSYYSKKHQPYASHNYTIFVAEVASTLNETLLTQYLLEKYDHDPRRKAYILTREIENIRATFFRQTLFAEYEIGIRPGQTSPKRLSQSLKFHNQKVPRKSHVLSPQLSSLNRV